MDGVDAWRGNLYSIKSQNAIINVVLPCHLKSIMEIHFKSILPPKKAAEPNLKILAKELQFKLFFCFLAGWTNNLNIGNYKLNLNGVYIDTSDITSFSRNN